MLVEQIENENKIKGVWNMNFHSTFFKALDFKSFKKIVNYFKLFKNLRLLVNGCINVE